MDTRHVQEDATKPTGRVTVDTSRPNAPSYVIHENVAWDYLEFDEGSEALMQNASAVCFGTLAQRNPTSRETIHRSLEAARHAIVVYDVNLRQSWYQKNWIEDSLRSSNIVKLNRDEVEVLSDLLGTSTDEPKRFADVLRQRYGPELICVTRGQEGCLLIGETDAADEPGMRIDVVDAVGAGDAFTAAMISARLRGWSLATTAWFANQVGALVATRRGAMPNLAEELGRMVAKAKSEPSGRAE
jgi:fructokinase